MRGCIALIAFVVACGGTDSGDDGGNTGTPTLFDACGGQIVRANGSIDTAEYARVASAWDRAAIDCRLGPTFVYYHPDDLDAARATAPEMPTSPHTGSLCPNGVNHTDEGPATYGSTSGQVAYAPDDPTDAGLDRVQTAGWEPGGQCWKPLVNNQLKKTHPDQAIVDWQARSITVGTPIAKARTEYAETGDGIMIFSSGLVASDGTQTSGSTHPTLQLPPNKKPMAVAISNYNEFAVVAVWDTDANKGQLAVLVLRAPAPSAHSVNAFAAPNEGGFDQIQLLGYVDLPFATPTAVSFAGNNQGHNGPWIQGGGCDHAYQGVGTLFADLTYDGMLSNCGNSVWTSDPTMEPGFFANAGAVMVASQWENKVAFIDMTPLFQFVRSVYVEPIQNQDNRDLYTQAITSTPWPFDFSTNPEMIPQLVTTIDVDQPRLVRYGVKANKNGKGLQKSLLAYVASLDGKLTAYDVTTLDASIHEVASAMVDPNPTSLHLLNANDQLSLSSRGNRSVQWLQVNEASIDTTETFRDARVNDPVSTDKNQRMPIITIGDFSSGQVFGFERATDGTYLYEGSMQYPGAVYLVDTANVN
ncbi:MAG TPA: hypothetical protein VGM90_17925 [Kofleriaceae bacterium]